MGHGLQHLFLHGLTHAKPFFAANGMRKASERTIDDIFTEEKEQRFMKKLVYFAAVMLLLLSLWGCGHTLRGTDELIQKAER